MARRKKSSPLDDVLDLLAMLPWWVCLLLAALSYALLHRLAAPLQAADFQGQGGAIAGAMMQKAVIHGLASAGQYLVPLLCLAAAAMSAWRRKHRQSLLADVAHAPNADALEGISWREFELLVGEAYRQQGYRVTELGGNGADGGVDLVLLKGGEKFFVQCKQWKAYKVGVDVVRELYGVMAAKGAAGGFVVTSGTFTQEAMAFADGRNVQLVDGQKLQELLAAGKIVPRSTPRPTPPASPELTTMVVCPACSHPMVRRVAKHGPNAGQAFYGCSTYPVCKGTRPA